MTHDTLEPPRAEPDYEMADDMSEFAIEHADELAAMGRWTGPKESAA